MHWSKSMPWPVCNEFPRQSSNRKRGTKMTETKVEKIHKTDEEWRAELTPEQYYITRQKGTEPAFSGALYRNHDDGIYRCIACDAELFKSDEKFESGSGWPSFWQPSPNAV